MWTLLRSLAGPWADAASQLKGKMDLEAQDATQHGSIGQRYGVQGYPTIKYFALRLLHRARGLTEADSLGLSSLPRRRPQRISVLRGQSDHGRGQWAEAGAPLPLCVIAFPLPHILDCDANCRQPHEDMTKLRGQVQEEELGWLWSKGLWPQPDFESSVEVRGFGYPAMVGPQPPEDEILDTDWVQL